MNSNITSLIIHQQSTREMSQRNGYVPRIKNHRIVSDTRVDVISEAAHDAMRFGIIRSNSENLLTNMTAYRNSR